MNTDTDIASAATTLLSSRIFRQVAISPCSARDLIDILLRAGVARPSDTIRALARRCDLWLRHHYRNDHVYRGSLIRSLLPLSGKTILPEFRVNRSIADCLVVSEDIEIVEIKSDLDNLTRLAAQLAAYVQVSPKVSVVVRPTALEQLIAKVDAAVGIMTIDQHGHLRVARTPTRTVSSLSNLAMLRSLRRAEALDALRGVGIEPPALPNTRIHGWMLDMAFGVPTTQFYEQFRLQLMKRRLAISSINMRKFPTALYPALFAVRPKPAVQRNLIRWLDQGVAHVCT